MVSRLVPAHVDPNTAPRDYWRRYHDLRRVRQAEVRPDDPLRSDEDEEEWIKRGHPFELQAHYEISEGGVMVSSYYCESAKPGTPGYDTNAHLFWSDIYVHPSHRRRGIGTSWLPLIVELMKERSCTTANFYTEDEPGHAFLKWLGAEAKMTDVESRLDLRTVDWDMVERWVAEGRARSPQATLHVYDGPLPEAMLAEFAPQFTNLLNTIPFEDLDHGEIVVTPEELKHWAARMEAVGEKPHTALMREPDGTMSALTDVTWGRHRPQLVQQQFTGVNPQARGRGIGKWIKAAMLLHIRELYPDARWIATENAGSNAPMRAINRMLGFQKYRIVTTYQVKLDRLVEKVRSIGSSG